MDWRWETGAILRYPGLPMLHCSSRASTTWYTPAVVRAPCGLGALHADGGTSPQLWTLLSAAVWRGSPVMSCVLCRRMPMRHSRPSFLFLQLTPCMQFVCVNLYLRRRWTPVDASAFPTSMLAHTSNLTAPDNDRMQHTRVLSSSVGFVWVGMHHELRFRIFTGNFEHQVAIETLQRACHHNANCCTSAAICSQEADKSSCEERPYQKFHVFFATASVT